MSSYITVEMEGEFNVDEFAAKVSDNVLKDEFYKRFPEKSPTPQFSSNNNISWEDWDRIDEICFDKDIVTAGKIKEFFENLK